MKFPLPATGGALSKTIRFGTYEFALPAGELRKRGLKIHLMGQPVRILAMLLERPGQLVTREEIRQALWRDDTFVNFELSLNAAMKRLRRALHDSAENPRFIETLPRRGYRFIAPTAAAGSPASGSYQPSEIDSLAVLPFENGAADPDTDYLSDGITETIINNLSRISSIRVMARSTVFRYKGREIDPRSVGRKLNVQAVLTGRILIRREALLIGAELVEVNHGWRLWGDQYNRRLSDILTVEEEISQEISETLCRRLTGEDRARLAKRDTRSTEAYWDYLKGRYHQNKMTPDGAHDSIIYFQRAVEKDGEFGLAYAGLADAYGLLSLIGVLPPAEGLPRARDAALRALALDESLAEAHCALAAVRKFYEWDWPAAEASYRRALLLNPHDANSHRLYASLLSALGRSEDALREILRARELDPLSAVISMEVAWHRYMARDYERAIEDASSTLELEPAFPSAHHVLGLAYEQQGRWDEAMAAFEKAHAGSAGNASTLASIARVLAALGNAGAAEAALEQLAGITGTAFVPPYYCALVNASLQRTDAALLDLENAYAARDLWLVWLNCDPRFDGLRSDLRFQNLLRRIGFQA